MNTCFYVNEARGMDDMKKELQRTFDEYFEQFEKSEEVNTKIKRLILENLGLQEELYPIFDRFLEIAKRKKYAYSTALGYSMLFFVLDGKNIDLAIAYNEKARKLFEQIPGYENMEGILTVANNAVLANILKEDYGAAYLEILHAMPMAEKKDRITYYSAFLNNGAIILSEFGLYGKAFQQVEETLQKRDFIGESNYIITIFLYGNLSSSAHDSKRLREMIDKYEDFINTTELFDTSTFYKFHVEAAIWDHNIEEAKRTFAYLQEHYRYESHDMIDNVELYLVCARYYMLLEEYEQAEHYYQIVMQNVEKMLGHKREIHEEYSFLKAKQGHYQEAYEALKEAHERSNRYVHFIDDLYRHELEDVWEKNRMLSYEVLYKRLLGITTFGKTITSSLTRSQLLEVIQKRLAQNFDFGVCHLFLYQEQKNEFISLDGTICLPATHPILEQCVKQKTAIRYRNVQEGDALCEQLGEVYQNELRSLLLQPVVYQDSVSAIIYFGSNQINFFSQEDQGLLQVFADYVAIALHNIYQFEDALEKSSYDYLTNTLNRSALMMRGEQMLTKAKKCHQSLGVLMIDIDNFKHINDTYGHMQGDEVIRKVTSVMEEYKQHGIIARFGGEEFILLIDHVSKEQLYQIAEAIRYACERALVTTKEGDIHFTISIGCCHRDNIDGNLQGMFEEADQRLYVAKRNGKNYVQM